MSSQSVQIKNKAILQRKRKLFDLSDIFCLQSPEGLITLSLDDVAVKPGQKIRVFIYIRFISK